MNKEKDFFKTCFNTVAGLEVKNESEAIAKEVVLSEIERLEQENKQLKEKLDKYENPEDMTLFAMWCTEKVKEENQKLQTIANNCKQLKDNWDKLKEYVSAEWYCYDNDSVEFEVAKYILNKMQELEQGSDSNE